MTRVAESISPEVIGERLRIARESVDITQAEAAEEIQVARTTFVAIEKGKRRVRIDELQKLAALYRTSANALLRQEAVYVDLKPRFRKLPDHKNSAVDDASQLLSNLVRAEVELENLLGVRRVRNYPQERPPLPGDVRAQAEQDAFEVRQWLGLGLSPIADIVSLLELQVGARVFVRKLPQGISGLFAFEESVGAAILLNANHPRERRAQTAAHELGHLVGSRHQPEVLHEGTVTNSREERYADAFGRAFKAPARAVMQKFHEVTAGAQRLTRRHVIVLAYVFAISREALVRRLEELDLVKPGTWDWFEANGGITDAQAREVLGDVVVPDIGKADAGRPLSLRLNMLAAEAWRRELLSEGQLARLLQLTRTELRTILDSVADEEDAGAALDLRR